MGIKHLFDTDVAVKYGVNCAILLENIRYWVDKNKANGQNFHDGKYWTYNSRNAWAALFPYMNARQIGYTLNKLVDEGLLETGNYNASAYDRTLWYAITEKGYSILQNCEMDETKNVNQNDEIVTPIPYINTDNKPNNKPDNKLEETRVSKDTLPKEKSGKSEKTGPFVYFLLKLLM